MSLDHVVNRIETVTLWPEEFLMTKGDTRQQFISDGKTESDSGFYLI